MNWLDIVIILLLLYAVWEGWRQGVITQVLGLAALALGIFLAWRSGAAIGGWLGMEGLAATVAGFVIVLVVVIVAVVLIGRLTRGLFRIVGLGVFDNILGVLFSMFKMLLISGIILSLITFADPKGKVLKPEVTQRSVMYRAAVKTADFVFPYIHQLTDNLFGRDGE